MIKSETTKHNELIESIIDINKNFYEEHKDLELTKKCKELRLGDFIKVIKTYGERKENEYYKIIKAINIKTYEKIQLIFKVLEWNQYFNHSYEITLSGKILLNNDKKISFEIVKDKEDFEAIEKITINREKNSILKFIKDYKIEDLDLEKLRKIKSILEEN